MPYAYACERPFSFARVLHQVGTDKWPSTVTFRGGHRLHFLFHSDSSNNEWGYKFKVVAKGQYKVIAEGQYKVIA